MLPERRGLGLPIPVQRRLGAGFCKAVEPRVLCSGAAVKRALSLPEISIIAANLSGRGDKDIFTVAKHLGVTMKV